MIALSLLMPTIQRFSNCKVTINPMDHNPPHFHVLFNDGREAWVAIASLAVLHGAVSKRELADVLAWAATQQAELTHLFMSLQS
jgi:hypothetical protein